MLFYYVEYSIKPQNTKFTFRCEAMIGWLMVQYKHKYKYKLILPIQNTNTYVTHVQVRSSVGMVDATDLEPCTEYLVMIRS